MPVADNKTTHTYVRGRDNINVPLNYHLDIKRTVNWCCIRAPFYRSCAPCLRTHVSHVTIMFIAMQKKKSAIIYIKAEVTRIIHEGENFIVFRTIWNVRNEIFPVLVFRYDLCLFRVKKKKKSTFKLLSESAIIAGMSLTVKHFWES